MSGYDGPGVEVGECDADEQQVLLGEWPVWADDFGSCFEEAASFESELPMMWLKVDGG